MLLNSFFHIVGDATDNDGSFSVSVRLNPAHPIYRVHFPGQPVTPGVCQLQMVMEILSDRLGRRLVLTDVKNVKYMAVIVPDDVPLLSVDFRKVALEGEVCTLTAVLSHGSQVFSKMSMTCHVVRDHSDL